MVTAGGDRGRICQAADQHGDAGVGRRSVAEFPVCVVSPTLHLTRREGATGVPVAGGDRGGIGDPGYGDGSVGADLRPVAELPVRVLPQQRTVPVASTAQV